MVRIRQYGIVAAAILVALLVGWLWGHAGTSAARRHLDRMTLRADLLEARGLLLEARVAIYNVNFGDASRAIEEARAPLGRAANRLADLRRVEAQGQIAEVDKALEAARELVAKLDQTANARLAPAIETLDRIEREVRQMSHSE